MTEVLGSLGGYGPASLNAILLAMLAWFIRREMNRGAKDRIVANAALHTKLDAQGKDIKAVNSRMECFEKAEHACQLENAKTFATKEEIGKVWEHTDRNSADIARIKGVLDKGPRQ